MRQLEVALGQLLQQAAAQAPGALLLLHVEAPRLALRWSGSAGNRAHGDASCHMRIASITKTYVATAILRLVEQGRLRLDDRLPAFLSPGMVERLRGGGYAVEDITLRMLLQHTSGIADYASQEVFERRVLGDPSHAWTREEQLQLAMDDYRPLGPPGALYEYADSNYCLLGEALEVMTGQPMPQAIRALAGYAKLGLRHTWFETLEPLPADAPPRLAQHYETKTLVETFHASSDLFGGGGILATLQDLACFFGPLVRGELFERAETAQMMRSVSPQSLAASDIPYGLGLERLDVDDVQCFGHTGYWGVAAWHEPTRDFTLTAAATDTAHKAALKTLVNDVVRQLAAASK